MAWQLVLAWTVFIVVCGFIAYWGDLLGRRMGKRRLSLFGLRPRYTAIVTTTITGMLIALLTVGVMALVNQQFRLLMLHGAETIENLKRTQTELARVTRQLDHAKGDSEKAIHQRDGFRIEAESVRRRLTRLFRELGENQRSLERTKADLAADRISLADARRSIAVTTAEIGRQKSEIALLEKRRDELVGWNKAWEKGYGSLREKRVIYTRSQEIARAVINCSQSKPAIRAELMSLLRRASQQAASDGASTGSNGRAIWILGKIIDGKRFAESQIIDTIVDQIYEGSGSVLARIYSKSNSYQGEQAVVDCDLVRNRLVYSIADEVLETTIDGARPASEVFNDLAVFLQRDVKYAAVTRGLAPTYGEDGESSVGAVSYGDMYDTVERIKQIGGRVRVTAVAKASTWTAGPLDLRFDVSALP